MTFKEDRSEVLIQGLHKLLGLNLTQLRKYAKENNILDVLDHPYVLHITPQQYEKIYLLKDFINAYHYLRNNEAAEYVAFGNTEDAKVYYRACMAQYREKEILLASFLDNRHHPIAFSKIAEGTVNYCFVDNREVLKKALQLDAIGIILAHNHPGLDPSPSSVDLELTKNILWQAKLLGIKLLDHIIVGGEETYSFAENGIIKKWCEEGQKQKGTVTSRIAEDDIQEEEIWEM